MTVTQDDLLDALRNALLKPMEGNGVTVGELQETTGYSYERIRKALRVLSVAGRLEVSRVTRMDIAGRPSSVPAYRIKS